MSPFLFNALFVTFFVAWLLLRRRNRALFCALFAGIFLLSACHKADLGKTSAKRGVSRVEVSAPPPVAAEVSSALDSEESAPPRPGIEPRKVAVAPPPAALLAGSAAPTEVAASGRHQNHRGSRSPASVATGEGVTPEQKQKAIDDQLTSFYNQPENGLFRISEPNKLTVGDFATVVVELRGVQALIPAPPPLQAGANVQEHGEKLRVSDQMSVKLISEEAGAFEVKSAENASDDLIVKTLPPNYFASWRWNVKALRAGAYHLHVFVYLPHPIAGADLAPSIVYDKMQPPIVVSSVPLVRQAKNTIVDTLKNHWLEILKWAWLALFVPLGHFLWKRLRGSKAEPEAEKADVKKTGA